MKQFYHLLSKCLFVILFIVSANSVNAQRVLVTLDNCDQLGTWTGLPQLSINSTNQMEGEGCLETTGSTNEQKFKRVFEVPVDITKGGEIEPGDAVFKFWLYVSDVSVLRDQGGQIELGSGGGPDYKEWNWPWGKGYIKEGWNEYSFDLSGHGGTGGEPDLTAINWFRMYFFTDENSADVIYRLDDLRVESKTIIKIDGFSVSAREPRGVTIAWTALRDIPQDYYEIEHSSDGMTFNSVGRVNVIDTQEYPKEYAFTDDRYLEGLKYYRLVYYLEGEKIILGTDYINLSGSSSKKSIIGKVITGYQGWFNCVGDGSPVARWHHWGGNPPSPGKLSFEVYPDISEYNQEDLYQTGFGDFGDGTPAKLFSSYKPDVIDLHMQWMKEYDIDGAALQRFLGETRDGVFKRNRDSVAVRMGRSAEKHDRIFYIMYDMSADDNDMDYFKNDWLHMVNDLKVTQFPTYAQQDGKPVICLWGFGFNHRSNKPENSLELINWLKELGYYVIGGVPTNFRTSSGDSWPGYEEVYKAFDMVSPWTVGRYGDEAAIEAYRVNYLVPDLEYCQENGMAYQPVAYSGFAWSQWNGGEPNLHPRNKGEFLWKQVYNVRTSGIPNLYLAMFDEYDEGTALMKNATDWSQIPTDQYFLTASADGYWLSSDFQLRVSSAASRMMKGIDTASPAVNVPHSLGPVYYRNSFEKRTTPYDYQNNKPQKTGTFNLDPCFLNPAQVSGNGVTGVSIKIEEDEKAKSGLYLARIKGNASGANSSYYYKFGEAEILIKEGMKLTFSKLPLNEAGKYTSVSLQFDDNTYLHTYAIQDKDGVGVNPKNSRGIVDEWTTHTIVIGQGELVGKTITSFILGYEGNESGSFDALFDDLIIQDGDSHVNIPEIYIAENQKDLIQVYPTYITDGIINIRTEESRGDGLFSVAVFNLQGVKVVEKKIPVRSETRLSLDLPQGIYIISVKGGGTYTYKKIMVK